MHLKSYSQTKVELEKPTSIIAYIAAIEVGSFGHINQRAYMKKKLKHVPCF